MRETKPGSITPQSSCILMPSISLMPLCQNHSVRLCKVKAMPLQDRSGAGLPT
jgi:hypothetical protein